MTILTKTTSFGIKRLSMITFLFSYMKTNHMFESYFRIREKLGLILHLIDYSCIGAFLFKILFIFSRLINPIGIIWENKRNQDLINF